MWKSQCTTHSYEIQTKKCKDIEKKERIKYCYDELYISRAGMMPKFKP